jgi:hypothetical protein
MVRCRRRRPLAVWLVGALIALATLAVAPPAHALAPLPACGDNLDNELTPDGKADWPLDPGCLLPTDTTEFDPATGVDPVTQCSNPNAASGFPKDPGCASAADTTNSPNPSPATQCSDGVNNGDGDTLIDYPADPGCIAASDNSETNRGCSDKVDNDNDGKVDFPLDWGCAVPTLRVSPLGPNQNDNDEVDPPQCNDGRDNDGDGTLDFDPGSGATRDLDCDSATDSVEAPPVFIPQCADGIDNDGDGLVDFPLDPGCTMSGDGDETDTPQPPRPACADGVDNDGDGKIDLADQGCSSATDGDETDTVQYILPPGNLGSSTKAPLLSPFPIVRLRGRVDAKGVRVTLLTVRAPVGAKVAVYCSGKSCPVHRVAVKATNKLVRMRRFETRLRGGTILKIYVTKPGFVGKYTRFRFIKNRVPLRTDRCATAPGTKPRLCPSS